MPTSSVWEANTAFILYNRMIRFMYGSISRCHTIFYTIILWTSFRFYFYHPQTKFAKVMFSQVSVCPQGGLRHCMLEYTHPRQTLPLGRHSPWADPPAQCMLGYGQQAGSTHPIGMHSCFFCILNQNEQKTQSECKALQLWYYSRTFIVNGE